MHEEEAAVNLLPADRSAVVDLELGEAGGPVTNLPIGLVLKEQNNSDETGRKCFARQINMQLISQTRHHAERKPICRFNKDVFK